MSGSFKKALKTNQKVHRERSQPAARAHLGLLEKKKDYKARAEDFQKKRDTLKTLKKKAESRNPDEFYFNMVSTQKVDGVHQKRKEKEETTTEEQRLLMEREDLRYVQWKRTVELKKIEKLKRSLQFLDPELKQNKHTIFVDTEKEECARNAASRDTVISNASPDVQEEVEKMYSQLAKRHERLRELTIIAQKLEMSTLLTKDKTSKKKLVAAETKEAAAVYRWCFERKR